MSGKDKPWSHIPVHFTEVLVEHLVLLCALSEVMFSAHHHKVHLPITETKPVAMETNMLSPHDMHQYDTCTTARGHQGSSKAGLGMGKR